MTKPSSFWNALEGRAPASPHSSTAILAVGPTGILPVEQLTVLQRQFLPANWAAFPSFVLLADARNIAHSREIIGVHYPSDSEAGRIFARQFVDALLQNDKFKTEFTKVREEWSRVRAQSPD